MRNPYGRYARGWRQGGNLWGQNRSYTPQVQWQRALEWRRQLRLQQLYNLVVRGLGNLDERRDRWNRLKQRVAAEMGDVSAESDTPYDTTNSDTGTTFPPISTVHPFPPTDIPSTKLEDIEGIGPRSAEKLRKNGISTVEDLVEAGKSSRGRKSIADATGLSETTIQGWVNEGKLLRIIGIGPERAELLHAAGVDSVAELAQRNPENLYEKLVDVNKKKKLVRRVPTLDQVEDWVEQAINTS